MLDLIRKTAVFIRADIRSAKSIRTAEVLEGLIDGSLAEDVKALAPEAALPSRGVEGEAGHHGMGTVLGGGKSLRRGGEGARQEECCGEGV